MWWGRVVGSEAEEVATWAPRIEALIGAGSVVGRVMVVAETASTQDVARIAVERVGRVDAEARGLLVVAGRQTAGRGRLGRAWADTSLMGVAATFAMKCDAADDARLSLAAGMAALWACEESGARGVVGMRWPNDVVERAASGRKMAGVLIERVGKSALVGVGINVLQRNEDWPQELRGSAVSLVQVGAMVSRIEVMESLVRGIDRAMRTPTAELVAGWKSVETLLGTKREFVCRGQTVRGVVEDIEPMHEIRVRTADGMIHRLPALWTSIVHGDRR